jgi:hypothetical protein
VLVREIEAFELLESVSKCFKFQRVAVKFILVAFCGLSFKLSA